VKGLLLSGFHSYALLHEGSVKYPQGEFPYRKLGGRNRRRIEVIEYELLDTGAFDGNRYFDVLTEDARRARKHFIRSVRLTESSRSATCRFFRPFGSATLGRGAETTTPGLREINTQHSKGIRHSGSGCDRGQAQGLRKALALCEGEPELLFTENETNAKSCLAARTARAYVKDGINDYIVHGDRKLLILRRTGPKLHALYLWRVSPAAQQIRLRLTDQERESLTCLAEARHRQSL